MSIQFQLRRGTAAQIAAITPAVGEILYCTDQHTVAFGDGTTVGGYQMPSLTANNFVGIGIATAGSPLTVVHDYISPASTSICVSLSYSNTITANSAVQTYGLFVNNPTIAVPVGITLSGVVNAFRVDGFVNTALFAGSITTHRAGWIRGGILNSASTAVITTAEGLLIEMHNDPAGSTITAAYGLHITSSGTGYTLQYDINCGSPTAFNFFAGQIHAGAGGATAPAYAFNAERDCGMYSGGTNTIGFATAGANAMTIDANQNVIIGGGTTTVLLYVNQSTASQAAGRFDNNTATSASLQVVNIATSGNNLFINFYTDTAPTLRGSISYNRAGAVVAYNTTSDERIKEIVNNDVFDHGAAIDAVAPHFYQRTDITDMVVQNFGFFAQELYEEVPRAVQMGSDVGPGDPDFVPWQVDNSALVPYLWAEVRSLRARLTAAGIA